LNRRRILHATLLATALSLLSGCAYLRLLKLKNQLRDFQENVVVADDGDGLKLRFSNPIARGGDFVFITESQPSRKRQAPDNPLAELWTWRFEKARGEGPHQPFSIEFCGRFEKGLLVEASFGDCFIELMSKEVLLDLARALGQAKVNKLRKSLSISLEQGSNPQAPLPEYAKILSRAGEPTRQRKKGKRTRFDYDFHFFNPETGELSGQFTLVVRPDAQSPQGEVRSIELRAKGR